MISSVTIAFRIRVKRIEAKKAELERIIEEKTRETKNQNRQLASQKEEITAQTERLQSSYNNLENLSESILGELLIEFDITTHRFINKVSQILDPIIFQRLD